MAESVLEINRLKGRPLDNLYAGIDEVAVSTLAGPMVCAVVVLPKVHGIGGLPVDSKLLHQSINRMSDLILERALYVDIVKLNAEEVDRLGERKSLRTLWKACADHVRKHAPSIEIIIDGKHEVPNITNQQAIIKADATHDNVSAAAIVAKCWTDNFMREVGRMYPEYLFGKHKGYPTDEHMALLRRYGISPLHRKQDTELKMKTHKPKEKIRLNLQEATSILMQMKESLTKDPLKFNEKVQGFLKRMWNKVMVFKKLPSDNEQQFLYSIFLTVCHKRHAH